MTETGIRTENLWKLTWPILIQNMTGTTVVFIDFLFMSYISDATVATVGLLLPYVWIGAFMIPVFAGTGVSVASQYLGAKQHDKVVPAYMMNLLFCFIMGALLSFGFWYFRGDLGSWVGMEGELFQIAEVYTSNLSPYFVLMAILVAYNAILSSRGMTHWLMYSTIVCCVLNVTLNSLFLFHFGWGLKGIVWATNISYAVSMCISICLVHYRLKVYFYFKNVLKDMLGVLGPMMRIGIPNALEPFSYSIQQIFLSAIIVSMGLVTMAANSYVGRTLMFEITFTFSLTTGGQILFAYLAGAGRYEEVNKLFHKVLAVSIVLAFLNMLVFYYFSDQVLGLFTEDPEVKKLGKVLFLVCLILEPARAVNIVGGFSLRTVGDARFPVFVSMIFIWGILPIIYYLNDNWGLTIVAMWICFAIDESIRAVVNYWRWRTGKWKTMGFTASSESSEPVAD